MADSLSLLRAYPNRAVPRKGKCGKYRICHGSGMVSLTRTRREYLTFADTRVLCHRLQRSSPIDPIAVRRVWIRSKRSHRTSGEFSAVSPIGPQAQPLQWLGFGASAACASHAQGVPSPGTAREKNRPGRLARAAGLTGEENPRSAATTTHRQKPAKAEQRQRAGPRNELHAPEADRVPPGRKAGGRPRGQRACTRIRHALLREWTGKS